MTPGAPAPPLPFEPAEILLGAGAELMRIYRPGPHAFPAHQFNPGSTHVRTLVARDGIAPAGRFHFFADASGNPVPTLYASEHAEVALWESVLRDHPFNSDAPIASLHVSGRRLVAVRVARELRLASLYGPDLARLRVAPDALSAPDPGEYDSTVPWAVAAWAAGFDGIKYASRRAGAGAAYVFFDRPERGASLLPASAGDVLADFDTLGGRKWLVRALNRWNLSIAATAAR